MNAIEQAKKNPMYLYLIILTISSTMGLQTWRTLFNNFAVEVARSANGSGGATVMGHARARATDGAGLIPGLEIVQNIARL